MFTSPDPIWLVDMNCLQSTKLDVAMEGKGRCQKGDLVSCGQVTFPQLIECSQILVIIQVGMGDPSFLPRHDGHYIFISKKSRIYKQNQEGKAWSYFVSLTAFNPPTTHHLTVRYPQGQALRANEAPRCTAWFALHQTIGCCSLSSRLDAL
jgi:hypothetical protein